MNCFYGPYLLKNMLVWRIWGFPNKSSMIADCMECTALVQSCPRWKLVNIIPPLVTRSTEKSQRIKVTCPKQNQAKKSIAITKNVIWIRTWKHIQTQTEFVKSHRLWRCLDLVSVLRVHILVQNSTTATRVLLNAVNLEFLTGFWPYDVFCL